MPDATATITDKGHYSARAALFAWSHWNCCLAIERVPSSCNGIPLDPFAERESGYYNGAESTAPAIRADLRSALARLSPRDQWAKEFVRAVIDLGPQDEGEHDDDWKARRDWFWWLFAQRRGRTVEWAEQRKWTAFGIIGRLLSGRSATRND